MTRGRKNKLTRNKQYRNKGKLLENNLPDQDENFYLIVGYTSNGVPYGITWDEHESGGYSEENDDLENKLDLRKEDFYYIAEITGTGDIIGITWDEYLRNLKEEEVNITYINTENSEKFNRHYA